MVIHQTTKDLLAESLKDLAQVKSVDKITVKELTRNCGLTAPTFYNHFRDKYELMAWIYNQRVETSLKNLGSGDSFEDVICEWMEIARKDEKFYMNLLKNAVGQNSFRYATNDHAIKLIVEWIKTRHGMNEFPAELYFCVKFFMRGVSELVNDWCLGQSESTPREMAKLFVSAMPVSLKSLLL